jgi:hypothetical protein
MAKLLMVAFGLIAAAAPASATKPDPDPNPSMGAPAAGPEARYCMRIEITGSRIERVRCWTREEWAEQEVDIDKEWARDGVRVIA